MYAVIALFDATLEQKIKKMWEGLESNKISYYAQEVEDRVPHITIASYKEIPVKYFINEIEIFYKNKRQVQLDFQTIGSFVSTRTLFYSPTVTKGLIDFHSNHHQYFASYNKEEDSLYLPGKWVPHCTLANRLSQEKLQEAYSYCLEINEKIEGKINRIGLIKIDGSKCAPVIYSQSLIER